MKEFLFKKAFTFAVSEVTHPVKQGIVKDNSRTKYFAISKSKSLSLFRSELNYTHKLYFKNSTNYNTIYCKKLTQFC